MLEHAARVNRLKTHANALNGVDERLSRQRWARIAMLAVNHSSLISMMISVGTRLILGAQSTHSNIQTSTAFMRNARSTRANPPFFS